MLSTVAAIFKDQADLVAENTALRHQLAWFIPQLRLETDASEERPIEW